MNRIRNGVIIIILCIVGSASYKATQKGLGLGAPRPDDIHDALAGNANHHNKLNLGAPSDDNLKDSLAEGPAIPTGLHNGPHGNTEDETPPPPRGGDHPGIGGLGGPNPGSQFVPPSAPLSPSGPTAPPAPPAPPVEQP